MGECLDVPSSSASEEPAGTHELKPDRTAGVMLLAVGCRDDLPNVDSGSVVSTCPVDYATSVPTEKVNKSMKLENVLGENHYKIMASCAMSLSPTGKVAP